jgi:SAM-dependent methyltransferase
MKRTTAFALLVLVLLAALAGACRREAVEERGPSGSGGASEQPVRYENEIVVRNLTDRIVTYTVHPLAAPDTSELRTLRPQGVDKFHESLGLVVSYWRDKVDVTQTLDPGTPYCFRLDEDGQVHLYIGSHMRDDVQDLAPYVPTPVGVAEKMLAMAKVTSSDLVYDLGCGDGRIVILAAQKYGAHGVGVDIDPQRIQEARAEARLARVDALVSFRVEDAMATDISKATVVTLYLLPESNTLLRPRLESQLKRGARVVTHNYTIQGWEGRLVDSVSIKDSSGVEHTIFLYRK